MENDKEIRWLVNILSKKEHRKRLILSGVPLSKRGFERIAKAPSNSKEFKIFFNELKFDGIIISKKDGYVIEPNKAVEKIKSYDQGRIFWNLVSEYIKWGLK